MNLPTTKDVAGTAAMAWVMIDRIDKALAIKGFRTAWIFCNSMLLIMTRMGFQWFFLTKRNGKSKEFRLVDFINELHFLKAMQHSTAILAIEDNHHKSV